MRNKFLITEKAAEGSFVLQNQRPGRIVNGKFVQINIDSLSAADKKRLEDDLKRYTSERERKYGKGQLQKDLQTSQKVAAEQEARRKAEADKNKPKPPVPPATQSPPTQPPAGSQQPPAGRSQPAPPAAPARQTPPQASPVAQYMKAAAAARKSGDPAEMAKVRDMGMEIWRKSNPKLAAAADEKARIRGTAQTDNPLMKDMRDRLPLTPSVQSPTLKKDLGNLAPNYTSLTQNPNAALAATPKPAPVTRASVPLQNPTVSEPLPKATQKPEEKPVKKTVNSSYEYDAYDLVLEYLLSEGHVDTIDEANYVMLQMSAEHIQNIVEAERVLAQRTRNGVTTPGYVSVNKTREGGFLGIGGREVSKPVPGSFTPRNISSRDAARYNQGIDQKFGTGSNKDAMPAYRVQQRAQNQGNSGYMRVKDSESIRNTGIPNRPTRQRAGDQNRALDLLRPDVPVDTRNIAPSAKPVAKPTNTQLAPIFRMRPNQSNMSPIFSRPGSTTPSAYTAPNRRIPVTMTDAEFDRKYGLTPATSPKKVVSSPAVKPPKVAAPVKSEKPATPAPAPTPVAPEPRLTKAQQDILDLRQMRAGSLARQGDVAAAQKLQTEVDIARAEKKMPPKEK